MSGWLPWREATERALYGPGGFYRQPGRPAQHFRTSVHATGRFAVGVLALLREVDAALGHPDRFDLVDVGAGGGELLVAIDDLAPDALRARLHRTAVEVAPRPVGLASDIAWRAEPPAGITGLVIANEWLDNVAVDVVEQTAAGPRVLLVDPATGAQRPGPAPSAADLDWLRRWWPLGDVGERAEVGGPRDEAWAGVVRRLRRGVAVAVDYSHAAGARPPEGSLAGYRDGRVAAPVPDGCCDITAHVALDACAAAGEAAGATATRLVTQRAVLRALGVRGQRPPLELARSDPPRYLRELQRSGADGELLDPAGLGGFGWLIQAVDVYPPGVMAVTMER